MPASAKRSVLKLSAVLLAPLFCLAVPAAGQQPVPESPQASAAAAVASPTVLPGPTAAASAFTFPAAQPFVLQSERDAALADAIQRGQSRDVAMMIVGGAVMVAGALIGGDAGTIIMVGGGVVGVLGLWRYLQ